MSVEKMTDMLKAIAHPLRFRIIRMLMHGEQKVGEIGMNLGKKQSLTSQQLSILRVRGIVIARRDANCTYYSLNRAVINEIIEYLED